MSSKIVISISAALMLILWSRTVWGDWGWKTYDRLGPDSRAWFWLRRFNVPVNRSNCVRFLKGVSLFGMAVVAVLTALSWRIL